MVPTQNANPRWINKVQTTKSENKHVWIKIIRIQDWCFAFSSATQCKNIPIILGAKECSHVVQKIYAKLCKNSVTSHSVNTNTHEIRHAVQTNTPNSAKRCQTQKKSVTQLKNKAAIQCKRICQIVQKMLSHISQKSLT